MPDVVAEGRHSECSSPVLALGVLGDLGQDAPDLVRHGARVCDYIEDTTGELHDAERMLEPRVRRSGVHEVGQPELMDMAKALEGTRIEDPTLIRIEPHKCVDGVPNLVNVFAHSLILSRRHSGPSAPPHRNRERSGGDSDAKRWSR